MLLEHRSSDSADSTRSVQCSMADMACQLSAQLLQSISNVDHQYNIIYIYILMYIYIH